jgi:hypothetical protein
MPAFAALRGIHGTRRAVNPGQVRDVFRSNAFVLPI